MAEFESHPGATFMTSDELRSVALAASARRGKAVASRRIGLRWAVWLVWQWFLPMIGLLTILILLAGTAAVAHFGADKVLQTVQTWTGVQLGKTASVPGSSQDATVTNQATQSPSMVANPTVQEPVSTGQDLTPKPELPELQLQLDRNLSMPRTPSINELNPTPQQGKLP